VIGRLGRVGNLTYRIGSENEPTMCYISGSGRLIVQMFLEICLFSPVLEFTDFHLKSASAFGFVSRLTHQCLDNTLQKCFVDNVLGEPK